MNHLHYLVELVMNSHDFHGQGYYIGIVVSG